jgi:DNA-binding GntR family transcriptional regulator
VTGTSYAVTSPPSPQKITSRLPGERALQQEFGLAPVTIRKAVHQLRDEGLVRTTPGWGTYVVKKNDDANP